MHSNIRGRSVDTLLREEFRHWEASFRTLAEALSTSIFVSQGKRLHYVNPAAEIITGYSRQQLLLMNFWDLVHPESREFVLNRERASEGDIVIRARHEVKILAKSGRSRWVEIRTGIIEFDGALSSLISAFDISERKEIEQQLQLLAATDPLTGLGNYRRFAEEFDAEIERSRRTGRPFALLMLDLDQLQKTNDQYGHQMGSQALCRVADVLRLHCRAVDTPTRWGGEEFAVILRETTADDVELVMSRIHEQLAQNDRKPPLFVSMGMAVYPRDGETVDALFHKADRELYRVKRQAAKGHNVGL